MKRVLLVEDEPDVLEMLVMLLEGAYELETASDGLEALRKLEQHSFDAMVLDLMMPNLDGAGVIAELRRRQSTMPVLLVSAAPRLAARAQSLGVAGFCPKPCDPDVLERELARVLAL